MSNLRQIVPWTTSPNLAKASRSPSDVVRLLSPRRNANVWYGLLKECSERNKENSHKGNNDNCQVKQCFISGNESLTCSKFSMLVEYKNSTQQTVTNMSTQLNLFSSSGIWYWWASNLWIRCYGTSENSSWARNIKQSSPFPMFVIR